MNTTKPEKEGYQSPSAELYELATPLNLMTSLSAEGDLSDYEDVNTEY